ncbi:uncharacterized protein LOC122386326 [Amphibalanus amphitrite]|uniref:uncharacterized protein LOC122386326 n=1 Tax=Amphibalanus amphitrite TaxID=1232801 RepID=UPI001C91D3E7|nr:uncharacterized protein LOC122386326 [Amphibalanus amphitrite]
MRPTVRLSPTTLLLVSLSRLTKPTSPTPTTPSAEPPTTSPSPPIGNGTLPSETQPGLENLHCFQCTGESTDPDDHCTDSGWISIPRGQRLDYRYLCPRHMDDFCMKTIERWESTRPGVADRFRTRRGCSGKTMTSQQSGDPEGAGVEFLVSNGCTDFRKNPATGAYVQMCFCDKSLCNTAARWAAPSVPLLLLLLLAVTRP